MSIFLDANTISRNSCITRRKKYQSEDFGEKIIFTIYIFFLRCKCNK